MKTAVFAGSFDPVTLGHVDIVRRAASVFDKVYFCAMRNDSKGAGLCTAEERVLLMKAAVEDLPNVEADSWDGLLVDYARLRGAGVIVRGIRAPENLPWELELAKFNREHAPEVETVLLPAREELGGISSTLVRKAVADGEPIENFVPQRVAELLKEWKGR